jgi:Protein of unknown function (DUF3828)
MPAPSGWRSVLSRRWTIAALCALPLGARGQTSTPDFFLRAIYDPYLKADFKGQPYWQVSRFFAPELARAIEADMREAKRRGHVPKLDGDPFLDAQDWEIKNLAISVKADGPKATGEVAFDNLGKPTRITLDLVQTQAGWRIADIKGPSGSLSDLYKQP